MKCWTSSGPFLSWVSGALLDRILDTQMVRKCVLPHSESVSCKDIWLFCARSFCMKQTKILFHQPISICYIEKKPPFPFCESYFLSPKTCYANRGRGRFYAQEKWGTLVFTSWIPGSLFFLHLSLQAHLLPIPVLVSFGLAQVPLQTRLSTGERVYKLSLLMSCPPPPQVFVQAGFSCGVVTILTNPTPSPKSCP